MVSSRDVSALWHEWELDDVGSWSQLQERLYRLTQRYQDHRLVWRGVQVASWGLQSSLYRTLISDDGTPPTEDQMVEAEKVLLERARKDWRFDNLPALELFAQVQHFGGPTRLIDVTENPLIATWFACELSRERETNDADGRVFALLAPKERDIRLNSNWHGYDPLWHSLHDDRIRSVKKWGTGDGRRYWRPPIYHSRIAAQSAGFLLDGVPIEAPNSDFTRHDTRSRERANVAMMRQLASIPLKLTKIKDGNLPLTGFHVFTFRISSGAKKEIREHLEDRYAIKTSTVYPDLFGFAKHFGEGYVASYL